MKKIPKKYQPKGFEIIYEDRDIIVGNKAAGSLTVSALWNKEDTVHAALNQYVRKGNAKSRKHVYVVHRLALHAQSISLTHPFSGKRLTFAVPVPDYFSTLMGQRG
jgi:23S rRNA-/tRNA-specific pseudouridylate synthase